MKRIKYWILFFSATVGIILGTLSKPDVANANEDRKICRYCTGECVTATVVHSCTQCTEIPDLCGDKQ